MRDTRTGNLEVDKIIRELRDEISRLQRDVDGMRAVRFDRDQNRLVVNTRDGKASVQLDVDDGEKATPLRRDVDGRGQSITKLKLVEADEVRVTKGTVYVGKDVKLFADGQDVWLETPRFRGTIALADRYDDQQVDVTAVKATGANQPTLAAFTGGCQLYKFIGTGLNHQEVFFSVQLPHKMRENTTIYPHVHWAPDTAAAGNVEWGLEYEWRNIGEAYTGTTTIYTGAIAAPGVAKQSSIAPFSGITPSATQGEISSILCCRLFRDPTRANDTYAADAWLLGFDIHVQVDSLGSRDEFSK